MKYNQKFRVLKKSLFAEYRMSAMMLKYDYEILNQVYAMSVECVQKSYKPNKEKAYAGEERSEKDKE